MKTIDEFVNQANKKYNNLYDYSKFIYNGCNVYGIIICEKHGEFKKTPDQHLNLREGCPFCKSSHMETEIRTFLNENNVEFEEQKRFSWLGRLSLDFYLPKYNIAIECQGIQHFEARDFFGGLNSFTETKKRDNRKNNLCTENNVKLLYYANYDYNFPYEVFTDKNKLLETIMV